MNLSSKSWYKWFILVIFWINFFLNAGSWLFPLSIKYDIMFNGFFLTDIERSLLLTLPMVGLIMVAFFSGLIIDKLGIHKSAIISFTIIIIFGFLRGLSMNFIMLSLFSIIFGFGIGINLALPVKLISEWFLENEYSTSHGLIVMASGFGIFFFELINKPLFYENLYPIFGDITWRVNFFIYSCFSLIALILWIIFSQERKDKINIKRNSVSLTNGIKEVIKNRQIWLLCIINISALSSYFGAKHFLSEILGIQGIDSSNIFMIISVLSLGAMFGNVIVSKISDLLQKRKFFILEGITFIGIFLIITGLTTNIILIELIFLFLLGFSIGTVIPLISAMVIINMKKEHVSTAMGFVIFFGNLGALLIPNFFEVIVNAELGYLIAIFIISIISFIGSISSLFLKEPKQTKI